MTVSLGVVRPGFAVVAADRLRFALAPDLRTVRRSCAPKVVVAPRSPVAVAVNGLLIVGDVPVQVLVQQTLDGIDGPSSALDVASALAGVLAQRIAKVVKDATRASRGSPYLRSDLVIATWGSAGAGLHVMHITDRVEVEAFGSDGRFAVLRAPDPCISAVNEPNGRWRGTEITGSSELVSHAEAVIVESIAADAAHDRSRIQSGGGLDVALVEERGAAIVASRSIGGWQESD